MHHYFTMDTVYISALIVFLHMKYKYVCGLYVRVMLHMRLHSKIATNHLAHRVATQVRRNKCELKLLALAESDYWGLNVVITGNTRVKKPD